MKKMKTCASVLLEACALLALTACGGGGGSDDSAANDGTTASVDVSGSVETEKVHTSAPKVTITTNTGAGTTSLSLSGTATDKRAITSLQWSNDRGGSGIDNASALASGTWKVSGPVTNLTWSANKIALLSGDNHITVTAGNASGSLATATLTVAGPAAAAAAAGGAGGPVATSTGDLCSGLVQDKAAHPMTTVAKPAVGQSYVDPQFGTTIRRISNSVSGNWAIAAPMYSTVQAWNADESYMILYQTGGSASAGHHLYNGKTYAHIKALDINPSDIEQVYWDTTNPKILYYAEASSHKLRKFNVDTDTQASAAVLHDFSTAPTSCSSSEDLGGGSDPMWTSWNSKSIGLVCGSKMFSYNLTTNTVGTVLSISAGGNAPQASPSGSFYFLNDNSTSANVRDVNMGLLRNLPLSPDEHASMGTTDGRDTFFSVQFDGTTTGTLVAADMGSAAMRVIIGESTGYPYPPGGTHVSAIAYKKPGWVAATIVGEAASNGKMGQNVLDNEVVLANANTGGSVCRVAHHHSCGSSDSCGTVGYFAEPHPVISPSGTRILYGSDWDGSASVDSYVVELPSYKR